MTIITIVQEETFLNLPESQFCNNFTVSIDELAVFRLQGYVRPEDIPDERVLDLYRRTMEIATPLIKPSGIFSFRRIREINDSQIFVSSDKALRGKNIVRTFAGAEVLCAGLVTIGPELEREVSKLFNRNNLAMGLMLDSIGSEAAEGAAIYLDEKISVIATEFGWNRTPRMSPGYGSFKVNEQKALFDLFDYKKVGVELNRSCIMLPQKSISFIIGCGDRVRYYDNLSPCRVCDTKDCSVRDPHSSRCMH